MNKNDYKKAMSAVRPSDQTVERIMDMTQTKKRRGLKKGIVAVLVILAVLICGGITANAATDGALFENVKLFINGEEVAADDFVDYNAYTDDEGNDVEEYIVSIPDESDVSDGEIRFEKGAEELTTESEE